MKSTYMFSLYFFLSWLAACQLTGPAVEPKPAEPAEPVVESGSFFRGADLSYVNEMLDCGATYFNEAGVETNPYEVFQEAGANLVRVRLWHSPDWTDYSDFEDVKQTIQAAKAQNMQVLLDFHYSDTWSDPSHQEVPKAWLGVVNNVQLLGDSLYAYTYQTLAKLHAEGLLPEMVQVGNEINIEILQDPDQSYERINWSRNSALLKRGLQAVRDAAQEFEVPIATMLHVAQPENATWWFAEAQAAGLTDYDWIGLSYYPNWSDYSLAQLSEATK
ncbi:MAG: glycosyl hydrolase 53 family protein, partial [Bacteroidota bacterium]